MLYSAGCCYRTNSLLGHVPLAELMPLVHPEKLQNLTMLAVDGMKSFASEDLDLLGTLAFFLPSDKWTLATSLAIRNSSQMHLSAKRIRRILQVCHDYCLRVILLFIATFISWDQQIIVILNNKKHHCTADWFNRTKLNIRTQNEVLGYQNGQIVNYLPIFAN